MYCKLETHYVDIVGYDAIHYTYTCTLYLLHKYIQHVFVYAYVQLLNYYYHYLIIIILLSFNVNLITAVHLL